MSLNPGNERRRAENLEGAAKFRGLATPTNLVRQQGRGGKENELWPVRLSSTHPLDEQMALRRAVVNEDGVVEGMGIATAGPEVFQYQMDKVADAEEAAYKQWVLANIDLSNPAAQQHYFKTLPWVKEVREAEVDRVSALQKQWAKIMLNGPQSDMDWRMIYAVQQKELVIPEVSVHKLNDTSATGFPTDAAHGFAENYHQGFFSLFAQQTKKQTPTSTGPYLPLTNPTFRVPWGNPQGREGASLPAGIFPTTPSQLFGSS